MNLKSSYPVICTGKIQESRDFFIHNFDFETTFEADWYVSLVSKSNPNYELALLDYHHSSLPENFRKPAKGVLINFEVSNVEEEYERLKTKDVPIVLDLKSEEWGQRHFIAVDPNGILIDVIQNIQPSEEFAAQYKE